MAQTMRDFPMISYCESIQNLGPGSGQHKMVSTEAAEGGTVVDGEGDD